MTDRPMHGIGVRVPHTLPPNTRTAATKRPARLTLSLVSALIWGALVPLAPAAAQQDVATEIDPILLEALGRDLGLSPQQASDRMRAELATLSTSQLLEQSLGATYAGAWFDPNALELFVATTDPQMVDEIVRNGARAVLVKRSIQELNEARRRLDQGVLQLSQEQKESIWQWAVDIENNSVAITIPANDARALINAEDFVSLSGVEADTIRIELSTQGPPSLFQALVVRGGDHYSNTTDGGSCSVGFSVNGGYVTAGHCSGGTTGDNVTGYNGAQQGTFVGSQFPGEDRAWVTVNGSWAPSPCVGTGGNRDCAVSPNVQIFGSTEANVGHTVCRYGATTGGPHCGQIAAKDVTVVFDGVNTVNHLTQTNACAQPGDSGGPYVWNNQGQGTLTGGSGNCSSGGTTYYYPLNLTLNYFGLTLVTANPNTATMVQGSGWTFIGGGYAFLHKGYSLSSFGSLSPAVVNGKTRAYFADVYWGGSTYSYSAFSVSGFASNPGQGWLDHVQALGLTKTGLGASSYIYNGGTATWSWSGGTPFGFTGTGTTAVVIAHGP